MKTMIGQFCFDNQRKWDVHLPGLIFAWNTAVHSSTGFTPAFLVYGRELELPGTLKHELIGSRQAPQAVAYDEVVTVRAERLRQALAVVRENLKQSALDQQRNYNLRRRPLQFNVGDEVMRRNYVLSDASKAVTAKLAPKFVGPLIVKKKLGANVYALSDPSGKNVGEWHVKDLKAFVRSFQW